MLRAQFRPDEFAHVDFLIVPVSLLFRAVWNARDRLMDV